MLNAPISTERFDLRELSLADVTDRYLKWFSDGEATKYIATAARTTALSDLRQYVLERIDREDVLFLGIFDRASGVHIGNIKYEPVDRAQGYAIMGILIGDPTYRGRGVAAEVLQASARWLQQHRGISQIVLGVRRDNAKAIRAYESAGFVIERTPYIPVQDPESLTMVWRL
jgi:ribosomal-protein-alanine N-acetyltransferase